METRSVAYIGAWLIAFALTVTSEAAVVGWWARRLEPRLTRRLALCFFANLATHPLVWFVFPALAGTWARATVASELWAWLVEAAFYRVTFSSSGWGAALGLSLVANLFSFGLGLTLWALGVWP
jgi:hypothetical protein